jgi:hypothetical protein
VAFALATPATLTTRQCVAKRDTDLEWKWGEEEKGGKGKLTYIWIFGHHLSYFGRDDLAVLAPGSGAFEDGDAFVHDGFEVVGFGVQGGDFWGRHFDG